MQSRLLLLPFHARGVDEKASQALRCSIFLMADDAFSEAELTECLDRLEYCLIDVLYAEDADKGGTANIWFQELALRGQLQGIRKTHDTLKQTLEGIKEEMAALRPGIEQKNG